MIDAKTHVAALLAACLSLQACSVLAPVPDRSRFFTLTVPQDVPTEGSEAGRERSSLAPSIVYGLGPITLPSYLDRREVATRVSPTELTYSDTDRWAEPLATGVASVLLHSLSNQLGTNALVPYPWVGNVKVDYQIEVAVLRFERDGAGGSHLTAYWTVRDVPHDRPLVVRETILMRPGPPGDTRASAAAMSGALRDLGQEIATALRALPAPREAETPPRRP